MQKAISKYLSKHGFEAFTPKAVLFDMDGVLYNSMPNHAVAWHNAMAKFGIEMTHEDAYATEGQRGVDTIRQMVKLQQGRDISQEEAQEMYNEKTRLFHAMPKPRIMYGTLKLMEKISRSGLKIGVVTGSGQLPLIQRLMRDFGKYLDRDHIVTAYDVKRGKPQPDPYLMGMEKCGVLPNQTIVVENAPLGVQAGNAALSQQLCNCCCENRLAIANQTNAIQAQAAANHSDAILLASQNHAADQLQNAQIEAADQLAVCQQTNTLSSQNERNTNNILSAIAGQNTLITKEFCDLKERELQNKINTQGDIITQLRNQISNDHQTLQFNAAFHALDDKIDAIAAKQPNTVPVQWPNIVAANATPYIGGAWGFGQTNFWN